MEHLINMIHLYLVDSQKTLKIILKNILEKAYYSKKGYLKVLFTLAFVKIKKINQIDLK